MKNWCKIVPFENHDILVQVRPDKDDPDKTCLKISISVEDEGVVDISLVYDTEERAQKAYEEATPDYIAGFFDKMEFPIELKKTL